MKGHDDIYTCHGCRTRHSTDNMVAYCAVCHSEATDSLAKARQEIARLKKAIEGMEAWNGSLREALRYVLFEIDGAMWADVTKKKIQDALDFAARSEAKELVL